MRKHETPEALKLDHHLCFPPYAAARKITGAYTPYLKELGLTYTQYLVMLVLWETDEISVTEICRRLCLDSGTLTPLLKKMEAAGLLLRSRSLEDERSVIITLTEKGTALRDDAAPIPGKIGGCVPLSAEDAKELYRILYLIIGDTKTQE